MNIIKRHCTKFKRYGEHRDGAFDSMEVHSIGCAQNTAEAIWNNMDQYSPTGIVHAIVDAETEGLVLETLPDENVAWADGGYGNHHSFAFEVAESDYMEYKINSASYKVLNEAKFLADINRGYRNAVEYAALKCRQFGFNPLDKLPNGLHVLYSHNEGRRAGVSSGHVDPSHVWCKIGKTMDDFRQEVYVAMGQTETPPTGTTDKVWMGWTKRESGAAGFAQTNGDHGHAYGKYQFDYRYALVPFLSFCVSQNAARYGAFSSFVGHGAGNPRLVGNTLLAETWEEACKNYPEEFEALQDTYAYQYYYLEAKRYIKNLYGINMDNHAPAVKGTLFSMAIRSGALVAARKFAKCTDQTPDATMLNYAYATYGAADAGRWTKAGQWGDALKSLESGEYTEINTEAKPEAPLIAEQIWFRVRKSWADAKSQIGAYHGLENAKGCADNHIGYNVYDTDGKQVYNSVKALIDRACDWAIGIANDNSHGYNNAGKGWGPEYNCIGLAMQAFNCNGLQVGQCTIDKMPTYLIKAGFEDVTADVDVKTGKGLVKGDVLWLLDKTGKHGHTELYLGDGRLVGARQDIDGKPGDSSGHEIEVSGYSDMGWQKVFRLPGGYTSTAAPEDPKVVYRVQAGAYDIKANADRTLSRVKAAGYRDAFIRHEDGKYKVQAWAGSVKTNAEKVIATLRKNGIDAIIK